MSEKIIDPKTSLNARETYTKLLRMYRNNWKDDLDDRLKKQYIPEVYDRFSPMKDVSVNIFRRIIRRICSVYKKPAARELVKGEGARESNSWEEWKTSSNLNVIMQEAHRLSKACTVCYLYIRASEEKERILLTVLTPDIVHVEVDPEDNVTPVSISYQFTITDPKHKKKNTQYWVYYTDDYRFFLNQAGEKLDKDPRTGEIYEQDNKYGIIPIVPFQAELPVVEYYNEHWNENAYECNMQIGLDKTRINNLIKFQTHKQIALSGEVDEKVKKSVLGEAAALLLGQDGQASVLDLTSGSIDALDKHIHGNIMTIAEEFGISPDDFVAQGNVQSGFALKIKSQSLEEIREADIVICDMVEKQLFETFRIIHNTDFDNSIPEDLMLSFNPGEINFPNPWPEEQAKWEFKFQHGVANEIDYLISEDPDLSRVDAEKKLIEIREETARIKPAPETSMARILREERERRDQAEKEG